MKKKQLNWYYTAIAVGTLLMGMLFYAIYNDMVILHMPSRKALSPVTGSSGQRQKASFFYFNGEQLAQEDKEVIISQNILATVHELISNWLKILEEEKIIQKKISLESVMLDKTGNEIAISFDRNFLMKEQSTVAKLMMIEGLLKTLRTNIPSIKGVRLLLHHKPLSDLTLDFRSAWPITGYMDFK